MKQWEQILAHLKSGRTITTFQAFRLFGVTRLPDRIRDCRAKGYSIDSTMIRLPSKKRVAQYSIG